jgi:hypothetical protein
LPWNSSQTKTHVIAALFFCLCAGHANSSYAWGEKGHRIVALIADDRLSRPARAAIADLLSVETDSRVHSLEDGAIWPDVIRGDRPETRPWHFVRIQLAYTDYIATRDCTEGVPSCLVPRLESFVAIMKDHAKPLPERLEALKFVVHLVGDLHQPLHCSDNMDRGGNDVVVRWFGKSTDLHAIWDSAIIERAAETADVFAGELINKIDRMDATRIASIQSGTLSDWVVTSHALARTHAYRIPRNHRLSQAYYEANVDTVDDQLINGGLRLAKILNDSLR